MKYHLLSLALLLPFLSAAANVDCSSPRYNNPKLKQYCQSLEKSSQGSIRSTDDKFSKDFSKFQLQQEEQVQGSETEAGNNANGQSQPPNQAPNQAPAQTPAPPVTPEPTNATPSQESVPTPAAPTPSGKPRRYY